MSPYDELLNQLPEALQDNFYERHGKEDSTEVVADLTSDYISQIQAEKPELLEALEAIMKCDQSDLVDYCRAVDSIACEAIAKAKGELW